MKPEAEKIERPLEKDYFEYRGNQIIVDYGHATNFIGAQDEYIDQLTSERDDFREESKELDEKLDFIAKSLVRKAKELQTLRKAVRRHLDAFTPIDVQRTRTTLKTLTK